MKNVDFNVKVQKTRKIKQTINQSNCLIVSMACGRLFANYDYFTII